MQAGSKGIDSTLEPYLSARVHLAAKQEKVMWHDQDVFPRARIQLTAAWSNNNINRMNKGES
ncbi:hypothetical protein BJF93_06700 [Xaviernesmea oryzae]|uniref:Uncharacterized protein n=1 Tax=Xaviernesmea oryzae TaxID=464029 RepID=A0A1Q9ASD7_9HYPH|nr:hypothetical protein BJF93_06700 [Xaviernesmea oryzae]